MRDFRDLIATQERLFATHFERFSTRRLHEAVRKLLFATSCDILSTWNRLQVPGKGLANAASAGKVEN